MLADGVDPNAVKKAEKDRRGMAVSKDGEPLPLDSFEAVAREWIDRQKQKWTPAHLERITSRFESNVFPWIGRQAACTITPTELLAVLRRIEARGAIDSAHRAKQNCGQVYRYAVATGRAERDTSADLRGALAPVVTEHHASITEPKDIGPILRAIHGYEGQFITRCALQFAPLVFVRPGELRHAEWSEIDVGDAMWRIPKGKMKARKPHLVPLSPQALAILNELRPLTGSARYIFPSLRSDDRPMSENTINAALRRLGYDKHTMTGHGFRSMASTRLSEVGWNRDAIERQVAHGESDETRAAYNYADHLDERRRMMAWWANYLGGLKNGNVVSLVRAG